MQNKLKDFFSSSAGKVLCVVLLIFIGIAIGSIKKTSPQTVAENTSQESSEQVPVPTESAPVTTQPIITNSPASVSEQKVVLKKSVTATTSKTPVVPVPTTTPSPQADPTPTPVTSSKEWHIVKTFSGTSNTNTDSFSMKGTKYRFSTTCYPLDTDIPTSSVFGTIRSTAGFTSGYENFENSLHCPVVAHISYVYAQDPGDWYLAIQSINNKFVITVEDYY